MDSEDERISLVACQTVLERAWGKARDVPPDAAGSSLSGLNLAAMPPEQRAALISAVALIQRLMGRENVDMETTCRGSVVVERQATSAESEAGDDGKPLTTKG
jgi:hypothetical protein